MGVLLGAALSLVTSLLLHLLIWRIRLPRYQTRTLLLLFFGVPVFLLSVWAVSELGGRLLPGSMPELLQTFFLIAAFSLAYIISYSAIEAQSPTLVLIEAIAQAGTEGLPEEALLAAASDNVLVLPRIEDLVRDGLAVRLGNGIRITNKGRQFVTIFILYRKLLGLGKGG